MMNNDFTVYIKPIINKFNQEGINVQTLTFAIQELKTLRKNADGLVNNISLNEDKIEKMLFQTVSSDDQINGAMILSIINECLQEIIKTNFLYQKEEQKIAYSIYVKPIIGKFSKGEINIKTIASVIEDLKKLKTQANEFGFNCYRVIEIMEKELYKAIYSDEAINEKNITEELRQITAIPKEMEVCHKVIQGVSECTTMNEFEITLGKKGQIVIPKKIRDELSLNSDSKLKLYVDNKRIIIEPAKTEDEFKDMVMYCLKRDNKPINEDTIREYEIKVQNSIERIFAEAREEVARGEYITLEQLEKEINEED